MNREQKIISLKLAKEIQKVAREKGFKLPESERWWNVPNYKTNLAPQLEKISREIQSFPEQAPYLSYPAYDVAELGEILPKYQEKWIVGYAGDNKDEDTEAEARGKLLVYLIKNNKIIKWKK